MKSSVDTKIAFASCCKLQKVNPQPAWAEIQLEKPDVLLLLGDNIYLDKDSHDDPAALTAELALLYRAQLREPNFSALLADMKARGKPVLATYDDHDFLGDNRVGAANPALRDSAREQLVAAIDPVRTGDDVYSSQWHGNVRIVVLDTRYHRDLLPGAADQRDAILGARQWQWLEAELERKDSPFVLVVSSTAFHRYGVNEAWSYYTAAFQRLRDLLRHRSGAMVASGDIHDNELKDKSGVIEVVSSGVARPGKGHGERRNYGLLVFDETGVDIDLRGEPPKGVFPMRVLLSDWRLA